MRLTKFEKLLALEKLHNVESGNTFRNNNMCREFNDHIANNLALKGLQNLKSSNFHGALWDGTADVSVSEKETKLEVMENLL